MEFVTHSNDCFYTGSTTEETVQGRGICIITAVREEQGEEGMTYCMLRLSEV